MDHANKLRNDVQLTCIRRYMAATGDGPIEWAQQGYAAAFDAVWKNAPEHVRKDAGAVYDLTLATAVKVGNILG